MHAEIGSPFTSAVHAPQTPTPQVCRTLVRSNPRLKTPSNISSGLTATSTGSPFTLKEILTLAPHSL